MPRIVYGLCVVLGLKPLYTIAAVICADFVLLGNKRWRRAVGKHFAEARECFQRAVALNPSYARAHANIAWTSVCEVFLEVAAATTLDDARREIETALDIDDRDHFLEGLCKARLGD